MKILLAHNYYRQFGGEDVVFKSEAELLRGKGHEVVEFTQNNEKAYGMNKLTLAIRAIWSRDTYKRISEILKKFNPEVAHFHNTFLLISPSVYHACFRKKIPVVQTLHNYRFICPAATFFRKNNVCQDCLKKFFPWPGVCNACYKGYLESAVVAAMLSTHRLVGTWRNKVDIYIALNEFMRNKFIECGFPPGKICIKPNFVNTLTYFKEKKGEFVLYIGRLSEEKGVLILLKAWEQLKGIPLKIAGEGPLEKKVRQIIAEKGLSEVEYLGFIRHEEINSLIGRARFLIFPSIWFESCPITILEAYASGVPVLASRLGAMEEIVSDKRTGLLFEAGNSRDLASKVSWAWNNPEETTRLGQGAYSEYKLKYTPERNYEILMSIYRKAVDSKR